MSHLTCALTGIQVATQLPISIHGYIHPTVSLPPAALSSLYSFDNFISLPIQSKRLLLANCLWHSELITIKSPITYVSSHIIEQVTQKAYSILTWCATQKNVGTELYEGYATHKFPIYIIHEGTKDLSTFGAYLSELSTLKQEFIVSNRERRTQVEKEHSYRRQDAALAKWKLSKKVADDKLPATQANWLLSTIPALTLNKVEVYSWILQTPTMVLCFHKNFVVADLNDLIDYLELSDNYSIVKQEALKQLRNKARIADTEYMDSDELEEKLLTTTKDLMQIDASKLTPIQRMQLRLLEASSLQKKVSKTAKTFSIKTKDLEL